MRERTLIAINELFGYASINLTWIEDNNFDYETFANENNLTFKLNVFTVTFTRDPDTHIIEFGHKPDKKTMRKMINEAKGKEHGANRPKSNN